MLRQLTLIVCVVLTQVIAVSANAERPGLLPEMREAAERLADVEPDATLVRHAMPVSPARPRPRPVQPSVNEAVREAIRVEVAREVAKSERPSTASPSNTQRSSRDSADKAENENEGEPGANAQARQAAIRGQEAQRNSEVNKLRTEGRRGPNGAKP